ncbi:MAG: L-threonylcarbamoyladenylate synthase [Desulfobulbaceae bacterium]|nr:L-threonylcarbamoyladenylate synthase [Desulfobulbaceae bacterium]
MLKDVEKAAEIIAAGGVVAFPTETYYGLAVDPFNETALAKLCRLKKRQQSKPILTLIADQHDLQLLVAHVPDTLRPFMALWPAPLTLVFPGHHTLPLQLTGGSATIGVRISSHPVAMALIRACGFPVTATSANISGATPCRTAALVKEQFGDALDFILDGGATPGGSASTVIGLRGDKPFIIREGAVPPDVLQDLL